MATEESPIRRLRQPDYTGENRCTPCTIANILYLGPEEMSLVFVYGSVDAEDAGSVTFRVSGPPASGEWAVKDDPYRNSGTDELAETNRYVSRRRRAVERFMEDATAPLQPGKRRGT